MNINMALQSTFGDNVQVLRTLFLFVLCCCYYPNSSCLVILVCSIIVFFALTAQVCLKKIRFGWFSAGWYQGVGITFFFTIL